jgi:hypothetical protein
LHFSIPNFHFQKYIAQVVSPVLNQRADKDDLAVGAFGI